MAGHASATHPKGLPGILSLFAPGILSRFAPKKLSRFAPIVGFHRRAEVKPERLMSSCQQNQSMKNQVHAMLLGLTFTLASAGVSHAMSELVSISPEPLWPTSSTPDNTLVYNVTTV